MQQNWVPMIFYLEQKLVSAIEAFESPWITLLVLEDLELTQ
jgi:hypothetical protein